jgi:ACT domain-containing protein
LDKELLTLERNNRFRLKPHEIVALQKMRESETRNVLVIGDLHEPFCLDDYLQWCIEQYYIYKCTEVVFIGDVIDNHFQVTTKQVRMVWVEQTNLNTLLKG